jgi:peptidylprolyl isomerase
MSMFRQPRALAMALVVAATASVATGCGLLARNDLAKLPAPIPPVRGELRTQFSLRYIDIVQGTGAPAEPGKLYVVHYTGWLRDGTSFDSSRGREPLRFEQGRRRVIAGWDAGFEGMRVGGRRRLLIPYQLAYGIPGRPPRIPPCAELIFDVELLGVEPPPPAPATPPAPAPATPPAAGATSCPAS